MERKINWSCEASGDLERIIKGGREDAGIYAALVIDEFREAARSLAHLADKRRVVPEFDDRSVREIFVKEYRLFYCLEKNRVVILGIMEGKEELSRLREKVQWL